MRIYTIGYEGISISSFVNLLIDQGVETVVDVRELPLSRKPGFSKSALAAALDRSGLAYMHRPALGCPKSIRNRYRADGDWASYRAAFLRYLDTQGDALSDVTELATFTNCALVCYEADSNFCHRSMVADAMARIGGMSVSHLSATNAKAFGSPSMFSLNAERQALQVSA